MSESLTETAIHDMASLIHPGSVPRDTCILLEEPVGSSAVVAPVSSIENATECANTPAYGLDGYVFINAQRHARLAIKRLEVGRVGVNQLGLGAAENPFGGVRENGHGRESGSEGLDTFLISKFVARSA